MRSDSLRWWGRAVLQGLALGSVPLILGALLLIVMALTAQAACVTGLAMALILGGLGVMAWYGLSPATRRWRVDLPRGAFGVLEDRDGTVLEFVGPGPVIVPWLWGACVRDYVDFTAIAAHIVIEDVLIEGPLADLEVGVELAFSPVYCAPQYYEWLRQRDHIHEFQALIVRDVRRSVRDQFGRLHPWERERLLMTLDMVEDLIARRLERHAAIGLTAGSSHPVVVRLYEPGGAGQPSNASPNPAFAPDAPTIYTAPAEPTLDHIPVDEPDDQEDAPAVRNSTTPPPDAGPTLRSAGDLIDPVVRRRRYHRPPSPGDDPGK